MYVIIAIYISKVTTKFAAKAKLTFGKEEPNNQLKPKGIFNMNDWLPFNACSCPKLIVNFSSIH